jgi:hypothetical protein
VVNMLNIVKSNISPLRNRRAARNSKSHVLQILETRRQLGVDQIGIQRAVGHVRERRDRQLLVVDSVRHDAENTRLREACGGAGVGPEAEPEALEVEGLDSRAGDGLRVGVEGQLAELEQVEGACGAGLLGFGVRDYAGEAFDWALEATLLE